MVWVRQNLSDLDPADSDASAPTISRAISEPAVATGLALIITFTSLLLAFVVWQVASLCIAAATLVFWALFLVRDDMSEVPFWINKSFSTREILLIVSFLLYLSTFSFELYRLHAS